MAYKIIPITQRKDGSLSIDTTNIKIKQGDYDSYQLAFESNHDIPDGTFMQVSFRRADGQQSGYLTLTKISSTRLYLNMKNRWFTNVAGLLYMTFREKEITTQNVERILKEQSISLMIYAESDFNPIEDIIPSDFDVYKLEVDSKLSTKLDKDFSKFEKDTSIDGTELIPIYDNGTNKTINSNLLVNKVNTVNNVQPDSNKNITLKGNNIDTSLTYASLQDKTLDELFEMFYLLSIRGVYHEDTDDEQLMSIRTGEYKNINPKTIAVNVSTTVSNVQDELNNIKNQIQYVYLFKGVYDNEVELLKAYPNGVKYDDGIWCILTDTDTVWVYDNDTLKWKNTGSTISGVLSVNDITPDNNGNIHLSGTDIKATVSDNGVESEKNITQHLQQLYNYVYALPNIDTQLDENSTNPVENRVITTHLNTQANIIAQTQQKVDKNTSDIASNTSNISNLSTRLTNHINNKNNPHGVTKSQIGLGNVDNTSDSQKPVSTAQANAINVVQSNLDEFITTTNNNFNRCLLKSGSTMNDNATLTANTVVSGSRYTSKFSGGSVVIYKEGGNQLILKPDNITFNNYDLSFPTKSGTLALTTDVTDILSDKTVVKNISISTSGDNVSISETKTNLGNDTETTETNNIPLANDTTGGLMSSADYKQIRQNTSRIEQLEGQTTRLLYTASENPTASDINTFVTGLGYTSPFNGIAVVVDNTYHIWHYYENDNIGWRDDGADTVNQFTNTNLGTIKGTATDGKVYAETDGTGSVYGWDNLKSTVSDINSNLQNKANYSDLNNYLPLSGGTITPNKTGNFNEGIYIEDASNGWSTLGLGSKDKTDLIGLTHNKAQGKDTISRKVNDVQFDIDIPAKNGTMALEDNTLQRTAGIQTMWSGTQAEYDAITTKDATTLYFIKEA